MVAKPRCLVAPACFPEEDPHHPAAFRPRLECLEDRWVPSTLTVLNNLDSGAGSLRADDRRRPQRRHHRLRPQPGRPDHHADQRRAAHQEEPDHRRAGRRRTDDQRQQHLAGVRGGQNGTQVTLSGLTISNGFALGPVGLPVADGGGILNDGTLTVSNSTLSDNYRPAGRCHSERLRRHSDDQHLDPV